MMLFSDVSTPKKWRVTALGFPAPSGLQVDDILEFVGNGDGSADSKAIRTRDRVSETWGTQCTFAEEGTAGVLGGLHGSDEVFGIRFSSTHMHSGETMPANTVHVRHSSGGNGTWTAEDGG